VRIVEKLLLVAALLAFASLSVWLERRQEAPAVEQKKEKPAEDQPDYYVENFVATGLDAEGRQYVMDGVRMAHFPVDNTSLIEQPHVIQYTDQAGPRHVYADSGLISGDGTEVLLRGNVKVIESRSDGQPGSVTTTDRMLIKLKKKANS
jgi:lipopolysaccharide export system protein LptC